MIGGLVFFKYLFGNRKRETIIKNYESYTAVLHYNMDRAYERIHKDHILVYSLDATTLSDDDYRKASLEFIKLVEKLLGPNLTKEMVFMFGNYETFVFNLAEYFDKRYDEDEIRKTSLNEVMENEVEPEGT